MVTLSELRTQISSLPKGNVYGKTINGKTYWYHQYFENGKRYCKLLQSDDVQKTIEQIKKRKALEEELSFLIRSKDVSLSKSMTQKTGYVMSKDDVVARFDHGELVFIDEKRCPLVINRTHRLEDFLRLRVVDGSRTHARLLKKALAISNLEDDAISLAAYSASISDAFWFKPLHSKLKYKDIAFSQNALFHLALEGDTAYFPFKLKQTPELTSPGSFEKGWKRIGEAWWLYKKGSKAEIFSELLASFIAPLLGVPSALYEYDSPYIRSKNFADTMDFEPMAALCGDDDNYEFVWEKLSSTYPEFISAYGRLMLFDALINNVDRHNQNYGFLRDRHHGKVVSLAPNFDCNLSLISGGPLNENPAKDGLIRLFLTFAKSKKEIQDVFKSVSLPELKEEDFAKASEKVPLELRPEYFDKLIHILKIRYDYLRQALLV